MNHSRIDAHAHALLPRYARQHALRDFGVARQQRLAESRVLIVGVGGLGSPVAMYLAAAGIGALTLVDSDTVDATNLHRQLLFGDADVGAPKLTAAAARLRALNPHVEIITRETRLAASNARTLVDGHDVVVDATDNFPTRYALNDACVEAGIPFVYGSVARFQGQVSVFAAPDGPCYRCLFPAPPPPGSVPSCAEEGVLGVVPGIVGLHQVTEVIKLLTGIGTPLVGELLVLDLLEQDAQRISLPRREDCPVCARVARGTTSQASRPSIDMPTQMTPAELAERLRAPNPPIVLDVREPWEHDTARLEPSQLVPLGTLQRRVAELDPASEYVVLCHHGSRSDMAAGWLVTQGFPNVANLTGGIDRWSREVDPSVPRY